MRGSIVLVSTLAACAPAGDLGDVRLAFRDSGIDASDSPDAYTCPEPWPFDPLPPGGDRFCSDAEEGTSFCSGSGSGYGWSCRGGCWARIIDGPCEPPRSCGTVGSSGGQCRGGAGGTCAAGSECFDGTPIVAAPDAIPTLSDWGVPVGEPDPDHPGFFRAGRADPERDALVPFATGSMCSQQCDAGAMTDACGRCATCTRAVGATGLVSIGDVLSAPLFFDGATGLCRADCSFDPATRDACPEGHTCSPALDVCVEGCLSDVECRTRIVEAWDGTRVSILDGDATCDPTTLRCRWSHDGEHSVGDPCVRDSDCTTDVGTCLPGGACGELACRGAPDTEPSGACDGGRGVCLGNGGNLGSVCIAGCTTSADCLSGNACVPFEAPPSETPFAGYCHAACDDVRSDPDGDGPLTDADDIIAPCRASERCVVPAATAEVPDPTGVCRTPCTADGDCERDALCDSAFCRRGS